MPDGFHVSQHIDLVFSSHPDFTYKIRTYHRICVHFRAHGPRRHQRAEHVRFNDNLDIRMKWIKNETTDKAFESVLHKRYKEKLVMQRKNQVYDLMITLCSDVFHRLLRENENTDQVRESYLTEFGEIMNYTNTCFQKLETIYKVYNLPRMRVTAY